MLKQFQLPNKLRVFVLENHKAPVVTLQAWVRTGSADEVKGQEGLSHFIEHLVFKGTKKYKVGEIAKVIEASGGELNAYTSFDQTVFYMTLSSEYIEVALDTLSEMMGHPLFDKEEVDNEREVVIEEIKRSNDSPSRKSSGMLFSSVYKKHPYHRPIIGFDSVVKNTPVPKIENLFRSRYCPENMFLVVAGDFDAKTINSKIKNYFSDIKGKLKKVKRVKDEKIAGPILKVEKSTFKESYLNIAFKALKATEKEIATLDLLSYLLSQGETSRLTQALRIQKQVVNDIGASFFHAKDPGFFSFTAYLNPDKLTETLEEIVSEILFLSVELPSQEELDRHLQHIESSEDYQETIDSQARKIGHYEFMYNDPGYYRKYLKILKTVTPQEITQVVRKFFNPENMVVTLLSSQDADLTDWAKNYASAFHDIKKTPIVSAVPAAQKTKLLEKRLKSSGVSHKEITVKKVGTGQIIFCPVLDTKVISCRLGFLGGVRAEQENKLGTNELISKIWTAGTSHSNEQEIAQILEGHSSYISPFSGRNSLGLHLMTLEYQQRNIVEIFKDVLLNPAFPQFPFERERKIIQNNIKTLDDHPSHLVFMDFMSCLFKGHPYAHETFGTAETLEAIRTSDLKDKYSELVCSQNMTAVIAGGYDASYWEDQFEEILGSMKKGQKFSKEFTHETVRHSQRTFKSLKKEQSHIIYGFKGFNLFDKDKYALNVLQSILSGQGGRLFLELRDKASLAYSVSPVRMDGIDAGYFGGYIGCSPDKGEKAIQMLKNEFEKLVQTHVDEIEISRAKKYLIGKNDISLQKTSNISSNILFDVMYGQSIPTLKDYKEKTNAVTKEDIRRVSQRLFTQEPVISCVGPITPWKT